MKQLTVMSCRECPFLRDLPVLGGLTRFLGVDPKSGYCAYNRERNDVKIPTLGLPPGPERDAEAQRWKERVLVEDRDQIPITCPLRVEPVTVSLGS